MFRLSQLKTLGIVALAVTSIGRCYAGSIDVVPPGLAPGDQYRLIFVTTDRINGTSSDINVYNALVTSDAESIPALAALDAQWVAVATTVNEAIYDTINRAPGVPIYNLAGQEVAADATQSALFSGSILNPIDVQETGAIYTSVVWTGSYYNGGNSPSYALGTTFAGGTFITIGWAEQVSEEWILFGYYGSSAQLPLYGISSVLTVPTGTPEPSTIWLLTWGAMLLFTMTRTAKRLKRTVPRA